MSLRSFRDPSGWLEDDGERIVRHLAPGARPEVEALLASPLYARLVEQGDLIPGTWDGPERLHHPRIELPTYAFEWTPAMLADAARMTLRIQRQAWAEGWSLKDASAHNVLFDGSQPRLCDLLSLQRRHADDPQGWTAYGQFVRHFIVPLLACDVLGRQPRDIFLAHRDGLRASEVASLVPWYRHLGLDLLLHVRLPARWERRRIAQAAQAPAAPQGQATRGDGTPWLLKSLERLVDRLSAPQQPSQAWSNYVANRDHYSSDELDRKRAYVAALVASRRFERALDIGANSGEFTRLLAPHCRQVVALDEDVQALDALYRSAAGDAAGRSTLCIHANMARPTPPTGWRLKESHALQARFEGRFDLVIALAVVHHLVVTERLPIAQWFEVLGSWCRDLLLVEFVAREDPRFQEVAGRNLSLYEGWTLPAFLDAAAPWFEQVEVQAVNAHRQLVLLRRRA